MIGFITRRIVWIALSMFLIMLPFAVAEALRYKPPPRTIAPSASPPTLKASPSSPPRPTPPSR